MDHIIDIGDGVEDTTWMFRIEQSNTTNGLQLYCYSFKVLAITRKGRWIDYRGQSFDSKKFVLDGSGKRYAHFTKDEALKSFILRRKRQIQILKAQLAKAELAYRLANGY